MRQFDFKSYHVRAMNADESDKVKINRELKELYETLNEEEKKQFNIQLENFLIKEYASIKSVIDGVQASDNPN
ncbi:MAG TPA: hypothetical protein VL947_06440 [Cytophagales bacterium]|nr:hypothetical protein [Cytophagales bacterium]